MFNDCACQAMYPVDFHNGEALTDPAYVDCFIDRNGTQYYVESHEHEHVAEVHLGAQYGVDDLLRQGWIHFSRDYKQPIMNDKPISQAQRDKLFDIVMVASKS